MIGVPANTGLIGGFAQIKEARFAGTPELITEQSADQSNIGLLSPSTVD